MLCRFSPFHSFTFSPLPNSLLLNALQKAVFYTLKDGLLHCN